ncbi:MAG: glycosyltransferase family 2 protein [Terriglobales bacterium]
MNETAANPQSGTNPTISVIIPAYNTATLISACLDSVFAQTYENFEVLVVNDGSPDTPQLEKVLEPFADKIVYIRQQNKRAAGARNTAIGAARGEFLAFLDSDDTWLPGHLAAQMGLVGKDPSLDLVYANALLIGDPARIKEFMQKCPSEGVASFESLIVERCQIPISTVVVRKNALVKAGLFDETLLRCDDYHMWVRTAFHGAEIGYSRKVQARLNEGRPGSLGASRLKMAEGYWVILEKLQKDLPLNRDQRILVQQRAADIKARCLCEEAKSEIASGHFPSSIQLLSEANQHLRSPKLAVVVAGLKSAPRITRKILGYWGRIPGQVPS